MAFDFFKLGFGVYLFVRRTKYSEREKVAFNDKGEKMSVLLARVFISP